VNKAEIKLYVADSQFTPEGTTIVAHPWEPSQQVPDWIEGSNLFNRFSYCNDASYVREAKEYPTDVPDRDPARRGATWRCSWDPDYLIPGGGGNNCAPGARANWGPPKPASEGKQVVQDGFRLNIDARTMLPEPENMTIEKPSPRDLPRCFDSIACIKDLDPTKPLPSTVDDCWRSITINVTHDVQEALSIPGYFTPSWLIKRKDEVGRGAVHWFSREGANCNGGRKDDTGIVDLFKDLNPPKDSSALQPVLVVQLAGSTPVAIPTPAAHCGAYE